MNRRDLLRIVPLMPLALASMGALRSTKIASIADDGDSTKVQPSDLVLVSAPAAPQQNDVWVSVTGSGPYTIEWKIYLDGNTKTMYSVVVP